MYNNARRLESRSSTPAGVSVKHADPDTLGNSVLTNEPAHCIDITALHQCCGRVICDASALHEPLRVCSPGPEHPVRSRTRTDRSPLPSQWEMYRLTTLCSIAILAATRFVLMVLSHRAPLFSLEPLQLGIFTSTSTVVPRAKRAVSCQRPSEALDWGEGIEHPFRSHFTQHGVSASHAANPHSLRLSPKLLEPYSPSSPFQSPARDHRPKPRVALVECLEPSNQGVLGRLLFARVTTDLSHES
ncbi:hypothetical protein PVAR5_2781 [Paecilomyces variotii No. 5]|uniref:Uncharacterized protein n=1 Tax=Byssochlamys spectabilis (strain No. 5 / NBRC 109023) TaxID=1356009 RepID=V5HWH7_BYSSN|nr:hypothetical protein PVAR5_2781 [Paecilomyces variotii No. 5]